MSKKNWIKELRQQKGLTQRQASELLFVSERTWRRWEGNGFPPSKQVQAAIKTALG